MPTLSPQHPTPDRPEGCDQEIRDLVAATAPRLFAVVQEYTTDDGELDAHVAAWGLAQADGTAQVTSTHGGLRMSLRSAERAAWWFSRQPGSSAHLVWPDAS
jgi:hypothetical protein